MKDEQMKALFREKIQGELSGLSTSSLQQNRFYQNAVGGYKVKKKLTVGLVLALALMLLTLTAVAVEFLTGMQLVEQLAVPLAQKNEQKNYTHEEMTELLLALNENGITLDESSTLMQAFQSGRGYWERDTIREICRAAFGGMENTWTLEQKHWYGEMLVAIGDWEINLWLIPGEGDMTKEEARNHAAKALKEKFGAELPAESNDAWIIHEVFNLVWDQETNAYPPEKAEWYISYINRTTDREDYSVTFTRQGQLLDVWKNPSAAEAIPAGNADPAPLYPQESEAIAQYGKVMYYWPPEIQVQVYGYPHAIPAREDYEHALEIAKKAILDQYGPDALEALGEYQVGLLHTAVQNETNGAAVLGWDFMLTTDPEFLSDGYRVQFQQAPDDKTGAETIINLSVENANLGNG